jgi:hypothetical protein
MQPQPAIFEAHEIRRVYDEATEIWWFSVVDIIQVLTQQPDYQGARKYWKALKGRLDKEGSHPMPINRLSPQANLKDYAWLAELHWAERQASLAATNALLAKHIVSINGKLECPRKFVLKRLAA